MLEQLFQTNSEVIKLKMIVLFGEVNQYRLKGIFNGNRWQMIESRDDMLEVTQAQIDALCRIHGWVQGQPNRSSTMDFIYTFTRPAGQVAFKLHSRSTEQGHSRHLRTMAERDYGVAPEPVISTDWKSAGEAIAYGVRSGAYMTQEEAKQSYFQLRENVQPTSAAQMFTQWLRVCQERATVTV